MKKILFLLFFSVSVCSCISFIGEDSLIENINSEASFSDAGTIPASLSGILDSHRIILFGETHYVQQHQELILRFAQENDRPLIIGNEGVQCYNWLISEYISGSDIELPEYLLFFEQYILEGLRKINSSSSRNNKIDYFYFDMNHSKTAFIDSLNRFQIYYGLDFFNPLLESGLSGSDYIMILENLFDTMNREKSLLQTEWGNHIFMIAYSLIDKEIQSSSIRESWSNIQREKIIIEKCRSIITQFPERNIILNTGMYHAQKQVFMGSYLNRLGVDLFRDPELRDELFSISFIAGKGVRKSKYHQTKENYWSVDLGSEEAGNNLSRLLFQKASGRIAWLPLSGSMYDYFINIDFGANDQCVIPAKQYNALFIYPEVTITESMENWPVP